MNITLIGMPGAGKSKIGIKLADELGYGFVDTDNEMAKSWGKPFAQIFETSSTKEFLGKEEAEVMKLAGAEDTIISPGGSVVYLPKAMKCLKGISTVIFLDLSIEEVKKRMVADPRDRNARAIVGLDKKSIEEIYVERVKLYRKYADATINVEKLKTDEVISQIKELAVQAQKTTKTQKPSN